MASVGPQLHQMVLSWTSENLGSCYTHQGDFISRVYHRVSPERITRLGLGDTGCDRVCSLQNRITKPYLRLGDTLDLRSCYTRQGDFISRAYHRVSPERITRLRFDDTGCDTGCSLQNRITKP